MDQLAAGVGARPVFYQGQWDALLPTLDAGHVDLVVNGYELTPSRAERYLATRPYYIYQLQVMAPRGGPVRSFDDLTRPRPDGGRWRVGGPGRVRRPRPTRPSTAGRHVEVISFNGATDAMMAVTNGQVDATLQDLPAARFYRDQYPKLELVGPPVGRGYYVMYLRKGDEALRDALDLGLERLIRTGELRRIYERYGIWTEAQEELGRLDLAEVMRAMRGETLHGWPLPATLRADAADVGGMTIFLSVASMPLAMAHRAARGAGAAVRADAAALGAGLLRRGDPRHAADAPALRPVLPAADLGLGLPPLVAGIAGLAINYSAYEAEIYRAGLQAIPRGQMEAALALGMSRRMALRRIIVPQAVRIVIPPVTNDFIALFKDTSVCSVITLVELTKQYSILANSTGGVVEFAVATAALYLAMSLPAVVVLAVVRAAAGGRGPEGGGAGMIEVVDLVKDHGALRGPATGSASTVARGEVAAIIGPSGGGKSTFLRCLNGLERFQGGSVVIDGERLVAGAHERERRGRPGRRPPQGRAWSSSGSTCSRTWTCSRTSTEAPIHVLGLGRARGRGAGRALLERVGLGDKLRAMPGSSPAASSSAWRSPGRWR